jgi:signal transduction histidine kinase
VPQLTGQSYFAGRPLQSPNINMNVGLVGRMFRTRQTVWAPDVNQEQDYRSGLPGIVAEILTPLEVDGTIIGLLSVHSTTEGALSEADVHFLETVAHQVERCIDNARIYSRLKQTVRKLEASLADIQRREPDWSKGTHFAASALAHDLGKYAAVIRDYVATMQLHGVQAEEIDGINQSAIQIQQMVTFPNADWGVVQLVDVNEILSDIARRTIMVRGAQLSLKQQLAGAALVEINPEGLSWSLGCLIDNSLKALDGAGKGELLISSVRHQNRVEIRVSDTGPGIPHAILERLFIEPIKKRDGEIGSGKALLYVQKFIAYHGGTITVEHTGSRGTTMLVALPLASST